VTCRPRCRGCCTLRDIELRRSSLFPRHRVRSRRSEPSRNPMDSRHTGALVTVPERGGPLSRSGFPKLSPAIPERRLRAIGETLSEGRDPERQRRRERDTPGISSTATWEIAVYALPSGPSPAFLLRVGGCECLAVTRWTFRVAIGTYDLRHGSVSFPGNASSRPNENHSSRQSRRLIPCSAHR